MNAKIVIKYGAMFAMLIGGYVLNKVIETSFNKEVDEGLDVEVHNKFGEQLKEAREDLVVAKAEHRKLQLAEEEAVNNRLLENDEYQAAKIAYEANKSQVDILKKALATASEGNSTQVAVGSGDSAVAVSIKDTSKIAQLQTDITKYETEMKAAEMTKYRISKLEKVNVVKERTPEDLATIAAVKDAEKKLTKVDFERNYYRNKLQEDPDFMLKIQEKAYMKHYAPWKQLAVAILFTIPTVLAMIDIWTITIKGIQVYVSLKKGV